MAYFKQLVGEKIYLSPPDLNDAEKYCEWLNNIEISKNLQTDWSVNEEKEREILAEIIKKDKVFGIILQHENKLLGSTGLHQIDYINGIAQFGIFIGDLRNQNKGYGTEATRLILDFGFNVLNLYNIYLFVYEYNQQAVECYEKVGFKEFGRQRKARHIGGKRYDIIYMDILKDEYRSIYVNDLIEK